MIDRVRAARGAVVAGLATLAIAVWFGAQPAIDCGSGPVASTTALGAFQMAKSQGALDAAIGCAARLDVLNSMNQVDLLAFIASWGAFLILAACALTGGRLRRIALIFFGVAVAGDVLETATQLWIGARWRVVTSPMLVLLAMGSAAKWAGLAFGLGATGLDTAREHGGVTRWLGVAVAVFGMLGLMVFAMPVAPPFIGIAWLVLLVACAVNARRGAGQRGSADA